MSIRELEEFTEGRSRLLKTIRAMSQEQLDARAKPERWSVGEVVDHIILAHTEFMRVMRELITLARDGKETVIRKTFADIDCRPLFIPRSCLGLVDKPMSIATAFMPTVVRTLLMRASAFPIEHPAFANPRPGRSQFELESDVDTGLAETTAMYNENSDLNFQRLRIRHPLFGRMNGFTFLKFVVEHERWHTKRMQDTVAAVMADSRAANSSFRQH